MPLASIVADALHLSQSANIATRASRGLVCGRPEHEILNEVAKRHALPA
jgi:hypothetical protein